MEIHHRVTRSDQDGRVSVLRAFSLGGGRSAWTFKLRARALATCLVACCGCGAPNTEMIDNLPDASDETPGPEEISGIGAPDAVPIVVVLATDQDGTGFIDARERLMERLKDIMAPADFTAIRTFDMLPAIALSARPSLIAWLLVQAEVVSIEPDRTLVPAAAAEDLQDDSRGPPKNDP